jgi:sec-independent protein translocase protein TatA
MYPFFLSKMLPVLLFSFPGGFEWVILILIVLLFFGAKRIPELARGLGRGIYEFRRATDDIKKEIEKGNQELDEHKGSNDTRSKTDHNKAD